MKTKEIESSIEACETCTESCTASSTEFKDKPGIEFSEKLWIACADACNALIVASKTSANLDGLCKKCEEAFNACAIECEKYSDMKHCKDCAAACRKCAAECTSMLALTA